MTTQVYNLDGPKEFPFPYPVRAAAQLTVEIVPGNVVSPGDYEVVGVGPTSTQVTVRYPNAPTTGGLQLKISRYVAPERVTVIDDPSDITTVNLNAEFNNIYEALIDFEEFILNLVQQMLDDFEASVLDPALAEITQARDDAVAAKDAAEDAQQAAEQAEQGATAAWGAFRDRYWGAFPSDPSVSPIGNPPTAGDLYWNTTVNQWRAWDANQGAWVSVTSAVPTYYDRRNYIATEGQTTFEATYDAGFVQVWVNGLLLPPSDYEASTGTEVVLEEGVAAGTEVTIVGLGAVAVGVLDGNDATVTTSTGTQLLPAALDKRVVHVPDLTALRALTGMQDGQRISVTSYYNDWAVTAPFTPRGGGEFVVDGADATSPDDGGSVFVGADGARYKRIKSTLFPSDFGARHDGITDDLDAHQRHATWALVNNKAIEYEATHSYLSGPIDLTETANPRAIKVVGAGMGDQYNTPGVSQSGSETLFETPGTDLFSITVTGRTNSLSFSGLRLRSNNTKSGYILSIADNGANHQIKETLLDELCYLEAGGIVKFTTTLPERNGPYFNISRCFGYKGSAPVYLGDNVGVTIFSMKNCLFHVNDQGIRIGRGGFFNLKDVWFESCGNAIEKTDDYHCTLSLDDVYFENCDASIIPRDNTDVIIQGGTNLPGAFMDGSTLNMGGPKNSIANYSVSTSPVYITGNGVIVKTPESIAPYPDGKSIFNVPMENMLLSSAQSDMVMGNTINGPVGDGVRHSVGGLSGSVSRFAISRSSYMYRGDVYSDLYSEDKVICAAFMYNSSALLNGLSAESHFVIDGVSEAVSSINTFPQILDKEFMFFVFAPLPSGASFDAALIKRKAEVNYASVAQVSVGDVGASINSFVDQDPRSRKEVATVGAGSSVTFNAISRYQAPYFIQAKVVIDEGAKGVYELTASGLAENGMKLRSANDVTSSDIEVSATDGGQTDMVNITVTNNSATTIDVAFLWWF